MIEAVSILLNVHSVQYSTVDYTLLIVNTVRDLFIDQQYTNLFTEN